MSQLFTDDEYREAVRAMAGIRERITVPVLIDEGPLMGRIIIDNGELTADINIGDHVELLGVDAVSEAIARALGEAHRLCPGAFCPFSGVKYHTKEAP